MNSLTSIDRLKKAVGIGGPTVIRLNVPAIGGVYPMVKKLEDLDEVSTAPVIKPDWPWYRVEKLTRASDGKVVKWTATGMTAAQVNKIKIIGADGPTTYEFRRNQKPITLKLIDSSLEIQLINQRKAPLDDKSV